MQIRSTGLCADLYHLTMAEGYFKSGLAKKLANFNMHFRQHPYNGGFTVCAGLELLSKELEKFKFSKQDIKYLKSLTTDRGDKLFGPEFLKELENFKFTCDIWAVPEGEIIFPHEPMIVVAGPLVECQMVESLVLSILNHSSLIATKAARMCLASNGQPVLEFGFRRAPGIAGALAGSRACYIGGCSATSNLLSGRMFGIPVRGTHSHSWILSFDDEEQAFAAYAKYFSHNLIFLIDTYDTLQGVKNAIKVAKKLPNPDSQFLGVRIDSGDLAYLSQQVRKILDAAGFLKTKILASNDLDERIIENLKVQGAKIDVWAVGSKLITGHGAASLGGTYKISALQDKNGVWAGKIKISNDSIKINNPGRLQVRRFYNISGQMIGDALYDIDLKIPKKWQIISLIDPYMQKTISNYDRYRDLLVPVYQSGKLVYDFPSIQQLRKRTATQLAALDSSIKRQINPHLYPAGLEHSAYLKKISLITKAKNLDYMPID